MPRLICWSGSVARKVGLWGLGVEGTASLHRLRVDGQRAGSGGRSPPRPSLDGLEVLATDQGGLGALLTCDVVVKSPGISRYRPEVERLERAGVEVRGGLGLWLERSRWST